MGSHNLNSEDLWLVFRTYVNTMGLARQHLDSYNVFVSKRLKEIVESMGEIKVSWKYKGKQEALPGGEPDVRIVIKVPSRLEEAYSKPQVREAEAYVHPVTPFECRSRDITYASSLFADFSLVYDGVEVERKRLKMAEIPVMVKSIIDPLSKMGERELIAIGEDPKDPGGYFIINGNEKVIVAQEDLAVNRIIVGKAVTGTAKITHSAKVVSTKLGVRRQVIVDRMHDGSLEVTVSKLNYRIPFVVLMRALGLEKDAEIAFAVSPDPEIHNELMQSFKKADVAPDRMKALEFLGNRLVPGQPLPLRIQRAEEFLDNQLLPHIGNKPEDRIKKAYYLAEMANRVLQLYLGKRPEDDKDHYSNKRIRLAGDLIAEIFREAMEVFVKTLQSQLEEHIAQMGHRGKLRLMALVRSDIISERLKTAISTGNWSQDRTGISQSLDRTNWTSLLSHLRRVISPLSRGQAHFEARDLHGTHWGRLCPFETPEGANVGLVKNLALTAYISVGVSQEAVEKMLIEEFGVVPIERVLKEVLEKGTVPEIAVVGSKVFLDGRPIGYHEDGERLAREIRERRRANKLCEGKAEEHRCFEISVAHIRMGVADEVYVNADEGRLLRPVIIVKNGKPALTKEWVEKIAAGKVSFWELVEKGIVEFLDPDEEENAYVAELLHDLNERHTHLEIWPAGILGVGASTVPYAEHNQSPRNTYQSAMAKQALGLYASNFKFRNDTHAYVLQYLQRPIVQQRNLEVVGYNVRPSGQNMVVAIMAYTGYNIEDSLIFNKTSIDYGLARAYFFRTYVAQEQDYPGGLSDKIGVPSPKLYDHKGDQHYRKLAPDGIIYPEVEVEGGDVIIGRESPPRFMGEERVVSVSLVSNRDTSVQLRYGESGIVDSVLLMRTVERNKLVKVRVRDLRIPEIGDKFASRHGQKGVIGMTLRAYDMPYSEDGITPDAILNPHAIPSRMTVGQLLEEIAGKLGALKGRYVDATPFYKESIEGIRLELLKAGYDPDAREVMYDGRTGDLIERPIVMGVVFYQRLYHMVSDKMHARSTGKVQLLTRQPTEGKAKQGGLRFGEMERDSLVGHGAAMTLRDRMMEASDMYTIYVCNKCGHIGWYNRKKGVYECPIHGVEGEMKPVKVPYAFKLLLQELLSMAIKPELKVSDKITVLSAMLGERAREVGE
ncbi:MAG: DNA-directed RNA polymerase subunit B [Acidilobaceae archaeon]|nr:DNA-directed RNA polymerase subunit B [Acidilobaceae archaeon]MCX8165638.1 DNA-directed RNA polymerase subunit B [Acidilobaceae archaeon]MDW7974064.1 DNA-directed RNA polymerase subunit B [Sulfolobales archaeon]